MYNGPVTSITFDNNNNRNVGRVSIDKATSVVSSHDVKIGEVRSIKPNISTPFDINDIINNYFCQNLKTNLHVLNIFEKQEIILILEYFINKELNLNLFLDKLELLVKKTAYNLSRVKIINKINLITSNLLFIDIDKKNYILPTLILENEEIPEKILKKFLEVILYDCIIQSFINYKLSIRKYNKYSNLEINSLSIYREVYNISQSLKHNIIDYYYNVFISFYTNILNKHDTEVDYIFPMILDSNLLLSGIVNDIKGGNIQNIDKIQDKLEELSKEPYIKNLYTKSEIANLEQILNNSKINNLIKRKKISLSKNFKEIIEEISKDKIKKIHDGEEDKYNEEVFKDYINKMFLISDNDENINTDKLSEILLSNPNREKFLEYFIDKIIYNQHLDLNKTIPNTSNTTFELVSVIDNVFEQILNHDYDHNSLNLENDDIKFILMLETLEAIKNQSSQQNKDHSNVTLNVYKDIRKAKVNNEEISLSY